MLERDDDDRPFSAFDLSVLAASRVCDLKSDADDLSALFSDPALPNLSGLSERDQIASLAHALIEQRLAFRALMRRLLG